MQNLAELNVSVVAYEREGRWIAQCVEHDIAAFSDNLATLPDAFSDALVANLHINAHLGREGLEGIPAAPAGFRTLFDAAPLDIAPRNRSNEPQKVRVKEMRVA
ncbi:MAG: hypothetical protein ACRC7G_09040 [Beijerinckiaceae bacterium]